MTALTRTQLYQYARQSGFSGASLDEVVAIALAESGGDTQHINVNKASITNIGGKVTNVPSGTKDRGVLQINDWWNPDIADTCAFDPKCSFDWAFKVTGGKQPTDVSDPFKPYWVTVQNGAYKKYLSSSPDSTDGSVIGSVQSTLGGILPDPSGITSSISAVVNLATNIQSIQKNAPSALIRIALFAFLMIVLIAGFFLLANADMEKTGQ